MDLALRLCRLLLAMYVFPALSIGQLKDDPKELSWQWYGSETAGFPRYGPFLMLLELNISGIERLLLF